MFVSEGKWSFEGDSTIDTVLYFSRTFLLKGDDRS